MASNPDFSWQKRALQAWLQRQGRGIIEAVTGSGKTHVAIAAMQHLHQKDPTLSSLVIVPTIPLLDQWHAKLCEHFPGKKIGRLGGSYDDRFAIYPLAYVATIHSALIKVKDRLEHCWNPKLAGRYKSFLIADECHHYIDAEVWSKIVRDYIWTYTLGLSATIEPYGIEGFGDIVYEYSFINAHRDGLVPAFDLLNVGVSLTDEEQYQYFALSERIRKQFRVVAFQYQEELVNAPDHWVFKRLQLLMGKLGSGRAPEIEKLFLLLFERAAVYYMAEHKLSLAEEMSRILVEGGKKKIIVFFERIAAADMVNENIALAAGKRLQSRIQEKSGMSCNIFHSGMKTQDRAAALDEFRQKGPSALIVCRSLDEGLDIPEVDGAILAASTKSPRQRIQRVGRTLRRGDGKKRPIIVTLFARGTGDADITNRDQDDFKGVATVHWGDEKNATAKVLEKLEATQSESLGER